MMAWESIQKTDRWNFKDESDTGFAFKRLIVSFWRHNYKTEPEVEQRDMRRAQAKSYGKGRKER